MTTYKNDTIYILSEMILQNSCINSNYQKKQVKEQDQQTKCMKIEKLHTKMVGEIPK